MADRWPLPASTFAFTAIFVVVALSSTLPEPAAVTPAVAAVPAPIVISVAVRMMAPLELVTRSSCVTASSVVAAVVPTRFTVTV